MSRTKHQNAASARSLQLVMEATARKTIDHVMAMGGNRLFDGYNHRVAATTPPSTSISLPVIKDDSGLSKNIAA